MSHGTSALQAGSQDRRAQFVAAVEELFPLVLGRINGVAIFAFVAAFWGFVLFCGLAAQ